MYSTRLAALVTLAMGSTTNAPAQELLLGIPGAGSNYQYGQAVARIGDRDADGVDDFIVTSFGPSIGGNRFGELEVHSGAAAQAGLPSLLSTTPGPILGVPPVIIASAYGVTADGGADVTGDGIPDYVVGAPGAGRLYIYDGVSGLDIMPGPAFPFGPDGHGRVVRLLDADGDSFADLMVTRTSPLPPAPGAVEIINGAWLASAGTTGARTLSLVNGLAAATSFGTVATVVGDIDGDGLDDFAVGGPSGDASFPSGYVEVRSGATGALLTQLGGPTAGAPGASYGAALAAAGDWDGDGRADLLVGMPNYALPIPGGADRGLVEVVSGAFMAGVPGAARTLFTMTGAVQGERLGLTLNAADLNRDGLTDITVGRVSAAGTSELVAISGRTGATMWARDSTHPGLGLGGVAVLQQGNLLVTGNPTSNQGGTLSGAVDVLRGHDAAGVGSTFGVGCPCGVDSPTTGCPHGFGLATGQPFGALLAPESGSASYGAANLTMLVTGAPPGTVGQLWVGSVLSTPIVQSNGLRGFGASPIAATRVGLGAFSSSGELSVTGSLFSAYSLPAIVGRTLTFQMIFRDVGNCDSGNLNLSNAYEMVVRN